MQGKIVINKKEEVQMKTRIIDHKPVALVKTGDFFHVKGHSTVYIRLGDGDGKRIASNAHPYEDTIYGYSMSGSGVFPFEPKNVERLNVIRCEDAGTIIYTATKQED